MHRIRLLLPVIVVVVVGCGRSASLDSPLASERAFEPIAVVADLERQLEQQLETEAGVQRVRIDDFRNPYSESKATVMISVFMTYRSSPDTSTSGSIEAFRLSDGCLAGSLKTRKDDVDRRFPVLLRID